jgi:hypothetical protein
MKLVEPKKPRKPSEPYKPLYPEKPDEFEYIQNSFELGFSLNLLEVCEKLNIKFEELDPTKLTISYDGGYDGGYTTISHESKVEVKKPDHTIKFELSIYEHNVRKYGSRLKQYEKKMVRYNEEMKAYNDKMKVYNEEMKVYNQKLKELQNQEKLETFNKLKKELGL